MANTKKYISLDKLGLYDEKIKGVIAAGDAAALKSAKDYADSLAGNYDAAGSAATAKSEAIEAAKAYTDTEVNRVGEYAAGVNQTAVQAQSAAFDASKSAGQAQALANNAMNKAVAVESYVGRFTTDDVKIQTVVQYIDAKTSGIASDETVSALDGRIAAVEGDYLKNADKTELEGKINAKADQTALDGVSAVANAAVKQSDYDVKVKALADEDARIAGLVTAEAERAAGVEEDFEGRIAAMEAFFEGAAADEGEGENLKNALDTLKEIQEFATGEGTAAAEMLKAIDANADAIAAMDTAYKAADADFETRIATLEAIDHDAYVAADITLKGELEGKINAKADASALTQALEAQAVVDKGQNDKIAALEAKFDGEGSVSALIATAKQEAIDAAATDAAQKDAQVLIDAKKYADDEDAKIESRVDALEGASATHALASDVTALDGRVATAEGKITTLEGKMTAVEALAAANDAAHKANAAAIATKASQADLESVDGRVTAIETWHANFVEASEEDINALFA